MTSIKIKDVKGLMIPYTSDGNPQMYNQQALGFNKALERQGEKSFTINREKLISVIGDTFMHTGLFKASVYADTILANLPDLIECVKEGEQ